LSFDLFLPELKLALDYVPGSHYHILSHPTVTNRRILQNDIDKHGACSDLGIHYLELGFHWDRKLESLAGLIKRSYPHLLQSTEVPTNDVMSLLPPSSTGLTTVRLFVLVAYKVLCRTPLCQLGAFAAMEQQ